MSLTADRNLLFGVLALELQFVEEPDLIEALRQWSQSRDKSLGLVLQEAGHLGEGERVLINMAVEKQIERHEDEQAALSRHEVSSSLAQAIYRMQDTDLAHSLKFTTSLAPSASGRGANEAPVADPERARYEPLRLHARGGLGEVHVAFDRELKREVALKELRDRYADDGECRQRFAAEAEVTGGLEHPGIVPVYSLGRDQSGRPYYAMRFIRGQTLEDAIAEFHGRVKSAAESGLELRKLLRRFIDVCQAIDYAHSRQVVHRDLKPNNVMLGKYGETLVVDWGMAKLVEAGQGSATASVGPVQLDPLADEHATQEGSAMGTPAYMSPEQALGQLSRIGPATDIFSLGATLYQLLTGKLPYGGSSAAELLERAKTADYTPPRQAKADVPKPLEAICLKAMAREPQDRYATAGELAEDVERWMADEPVSAWAEPWTMRARRWTRRHRTLVTSLAATATAALVLLVVGVAMLAAANQRERTARHDAETQRQEAEDQRREAEQQRALAEKNFQLAMDAVDKFMRKIAEDPRLKTNALHSLRQELLRDAQEYLDKLAAQGGSTPELRLARAQAQRLLATITANIDTPREARPILDRAIMEFESLLDEQPEPVVREELVAAYTYRAGLHVESRRFELADKDYAQAISLGPRQGAAKPTPKLQSLIALAHVAKGTMHQVRGQLEQASASYARAEEILAELVKSESSDPTFQGVLSICQQARAMLLWQLGQNDLAVEKAQGAVATIRDLVKQNPNAYHYQSVYSGCLGQLGQFHRDRNDLAGAAKYFGDQLTVSRKLAEAHPDVTAYQQNYVAALRNLGDVERRRGEFAKAEKLFDRAAKVLEQLKQQVGDGLDLREDFAWLYNHLGLAYAGLSRWDEAKAAYDRAVKIWRELVAAYPTTPAPREELAHVIHNQGMLASQQGDRRGAIAAYSDAVKLREALVKEYPKVLRHQRYLAWSRNNLAVSFRLAGDYRSAEQQYQAALRLRRNLALHQPDEVEHARTMGQMHHDLGIMYAAALRPEEARRAYQAAIELRTKLVKQFPKNDGHLAGLAWSRHNLAHVLQVEGEKLDPAGELFSMAADHWKTLADRAPKMLDYWLNLAHCHRDVANVRAAQNRPKEERAALQASAAALQKALEIDPNSNAAQAALKDIQERLKSLSDEGT